MQRSPLKTGSTQNNLLSREVGKSSKGTAVSKRLPRQLLQLPVTCPQSPPFEYEIRTRGTEREQRDRLIFFPITSRAPLDHSSLVNTSFAVHYEKIRIHLRETATNNAKIHSLARKSEHLRINQIQLRFLHFNQHSITFLGIHLRHSIYKRENILLLTPTFKSLTLS